MRRIVQQKLQLPKWESEFVWLFFLSVCLSIFFVLLGVLLLLLLLLLLFVVVVVSSWLVGWLVACLVGWLVGQNHKDLFFFLKRYQDHILSFSQHNFSNTLNAKTVNIQS